MAADTAYIVILNWNGIHDTIPCIQSCLKLENYKFKIVVCDNGSTDGSLDTLRNWLNGEHQPEVPVNSVLKALLAGSEVPNDSYWTTREAVESGTSRSTDANLIVIDNEANLGFAAGNNVGIRYAIEQADMSHVWLLNNDTLVDPKSLAALVAREQSSGACVVGSLLKFFDDPSVIQAVGGNAYNKFTGIASESLGRYLPDTTEIDVEQYEQQLDYICGASMLLSKEYLDTIGLMEERYFLYYEEIDWAVRCHGQFELKVAVDSVVYHKEGSSIGSASFDSAPSAFSEFCKTRAKLWFTAKFFPHAYVSCFLFSAAQALNRFRQGYPENGKIIFQVLLGRRKFK